MAKNYWLIKCEPDAYSIDQFAKDKRTDWHGVRNYQARNFMLNDMAVGDEVLYYHSNAAPSGVAGFAKVATAPHPDKTALDKKSEYFDPKATKEKPIWFCVEFDYVATAKHFVPLEDLRENKNLSAMVLLKRGSRLSIQPVSPAEFAEIKRMASGK